MLIYIVILVLTFFAPVSRLDVAKLQPVEAVAIYMEDGQVVLETDTGDRGRGATARAALEDLKKSAPAVIYLDTAEYLLIAPDAQGQANQLKRFLKSSIKEGIYCGGSVGEEAKYLDVHGNSEKPAG